MSHSLRWRLLGWIALLLVGILLGFGITAYQLNRLERLRRLDDELSHRVATLADELRGRVGGPPGQWRRIPPPKPGTVPPKKPAVERTAADDMPGLQPDGPFPEGPQPEPPEANPQLRAFQPSFPTASLFDETEARGYYFKVWSAAGNVLAQSANAPADVPAPRAARTARITTTMRLDQREMRAFTEMGDCVLVGVPLAAYRRDLAAYAFWLTLIGAGVTLAGVGGGWWVVSRATRPIELMSATACRISAGNLAERIPVDGPRSELGRLAQVLNETFARLETAFVRQRQFTADASHELRTPLSVIISEAQVSLARPRSPEDYRDTIEVCLEAAQQMRRLSDSLLELARFDAGSAGLRSVRFDIAETARSCGDLLQPMAEQRGVRLSCDPGPAPVNGDPDRLRQVLTNLIVNAIDYNRPGGEVCVRTLREDAGSVVEVSDTGIGIATEDLPLIFHRFFRADRSRSHAEGHTGLGLAIAKTIVDAHGGTIDVASRLGEGTTFTIRLPA